MTNQCPKLYQAQEVLIFFKYCRAKELNELEKEIIELKLQVNPMSHTFEVNEIKRDLIKLQIPILEKQKGKLIELQQESLSELNTELTKAIGSPFFEITDKTPSQESKPIASS